MALINLKQAKDNYDVIIVGGGLGGLTAANRLGRDGYSVLLLEQHSQLGGLAAWFKRKGVIFDVSLHGFPYSMKQSLKLSWNTEMADCVTRIKSIRYDNPEFSLETTYDEIDFRNILYKKFSIDVATIDRFFKEINSRYSLADIDRTTVGQLFEKFFPGRQDVWRFLIEPIAYTNGMTFEDPAQIYGLIFANFIKKGVYTFKGGTNRMIDMATKELLKNKVDITTNALVEKILIRNGRVTGVLVGKRKINARAIISNGNIISTIEQLVGVNNFSKYFIARVNKIRLSNSSCQVYLSLKKGKEPPFVGDIILSSLHNRFDSAALLSKDTRSLSFSIYYPEFRPENDCCTIVCSSNAAYLDWAELSQEAYQKEKERLIKKAISMLGKYIPDIKERVDFFEVATPKTFAHYALHKNGASFGTKFEGLEISNNLPREISGLFHAGSVGIVLSGWLGVINYGTMVSHRVKKFLVDI